MPHSNARLIDGSGSMSRFGLSRLPPEVLDAVVDFTVDENQLSTWSLVHSHFLTPIRRKRFQHITIVLPRKDVWSFHAVVADSCRNLGDEILHMTIAGEVHQPRFEYPDGEVAFGMLEYHRDAVVDAEPVHTLLLHLPRLLTLTLRHVMLEARPYVTQRFLPSCNLDKLSLIGVESVGFDRGDFLPLFQLFRCVRTLHFDERFKPLVPHGGNSERYREKASSAPDSGPVEFIGVDTLQIAGTVARVWHFNDLEGTRSIGPSPTRMLKDHTLREITWWCTNDDCNEVIGPWLFTVGKTIRSLTLSLDPRYFDPLLHNPALQQSCPNLEGLFFLAYAKMFIQQPMAFVPLWVGVAEKKPPRLRSVTICLEFSDLETLDQVAVAKRQIIEGNLREALRLLGRKVASPEIGQVRIAGVSISEKCLIATAGGDGLIDALKVLCYSIRNICWEAL